MTVIARRPLATLTARPHLAAFCAVVGSLALARWWQYEFAPGLFQSLWNAYFFALIGWFAVAGVGVYYYRRVEAMPSVQEVPTNQVLLIAALVGWFIVALQIIVGMLTDFGRSPLSHTPRWLAINLFFAMSPLIAVEFARSLMLRTLGRRNLTIALVVTSLGLAALRFPMAQFTQDGFRDQAEFWGGSFIPVAATGLLAGFFALYGGVRAGILISAPIVLFTYFSPALPVAPWTALALAGVAGPAMGLWIAEGLFAAEAPEEEEEQGRFSLPSVSWVVTAVMGLVIFWFSFGFFGFRPTFIPSHSMEPVIKQGDVVLVGPIEPSQVRVDDIILYEMSNGQQILHRVIEIQFTDAGQRRFVMQGDNNNTADIYPVQDKQIVAKYVGRVPKLGWVAYRFNQLIGHAR